MSAGVFVTSKYAASFGATIHPIRVQPESITAAIGASVNNPPAGAVDSPISAVITRTNRQKGLRPRFITVKAGSTAGSVPPGYKLGSITRIPALTEAFFNAAAAGGSMTYLGETWTIVSKTAERVS